jgi:hypothetical protein
MIKLGLWSPFMQAFAAPDPVITLLPVTITRCDAYTTSLTRVLLASRYRYRCRYPHLTQSLLPGTIEHVRYKQHRLRSIFDRFHHRGARNREALSRDEVVAMFTAIHTRAAQLLG